MTLTAVAAADPPDESYTIQELDELAGALLWLGRVHGALAAFLDATYDPKDTGLIEYLNHAPVDMVIDLLPTTDLLLAEVAERVGELRTAVGSAAESAITRSLASPVETGDEEFDNVIYANFGGTE